MPVIANARRIINLCLFAWLAAGAFRIFETPLSGLFVLGVLLAALVGVNRLAVALGTSGAWQLAFNIAMFVPLANFVVMAVLSMRATKVLRAAGYQIGFFSSREPDVV